MRTAVVPSHPYLAPWYRLAQDGARVLLEYGQRVVVMEGGAARMLLPVLLPLLDGTRSVDELVRTLGEPARPAVENALLQLASHGVLLDGPPLPADMPPPVSGTVELLASLLPPGRSLVSTADELAGVSLALAGGSTCAVELGRLLRLGGAAVEVADGPGRGPDLTICVPSPSELPRLADWNDHALREQVAWMQVLPFDGRYAAIGPLYLPGETCCYECFGLRRASNLSSGPDLPLLDRVPADFPPAPALDAAVAGLAALLLLGWVVRGDHEVPATFVALELGPPPVSSVHHVHRVPRCPACSGLAEVAAPLPWHKELRRECG